MRGPSIHPRRIAASSLALAILTTTSASAQDQTPPPGGSPSPGDAVVMPYNAVAPAIPPFARDAVFGGGAPTAQPGTFSPNLSFNCGDQAATRAGTSQDDRIVGSPEADVIAGREGRDFIFGHGGDDAICGGPGSDRLEGGLGDDHLDVGPAGKDTPSCEFAAGGPGDDVLDGRSAGPPHGNPFVCLAFDGDGGEGDDTLLGSNFTDRLAGGPGDDVLRANGGSFAQLFGDGGDDKLVGGAASEYIEGGPGHDLCFGDERRDTFRGCEEIYEREELR